MDLSTDNQTDPGEKKGRFALQPSSQQHKASLEGLPVELRVTILRAVADVPSLSALVRSSPLYHEVYRGQRQSLLMSVLSNELTPKILFEASLVAEAANIRIHRKFSPSSNEDDLMSALNGVALNVLVKIAQYQYAMYYLAEDFYKSTLSQHPITFANLAPISLSSFELRRFYRACYRFEIFSYLFWTLIENPTTGSEWGHRSDRHPGSVYFPSFEHWEVEEIYCLRDYIYRRYDTVLKEGKEELDEVFYRQEAMDGWPGQTEEEIRSRMMAKGIGDYASMIETAMGYGLEFLAYTLRVQDSQEKILRIEARLGPSFSFISHAGLFLTKSLDYSQSLRQPRTRGEAQQLAKVEFTNDQDQKSPNAAWPWPLQFGDNCFNFGAPYSNKSSFRSWGYVMWDKKRLDAMEILEKEVVSFRAHGPLISHGVMLTDLPLDDFDDFDDFEESD
ncbi:hypothetical protein B0J14DRAFT_471508 [Halenospora varia]|nr:hypothetical protein B0J14DRAFT_471508 [Halenospora varia]